jgi:hypothetical protein
MCPQKCIELFPFCTIPDRGERAAKIGRRLVELELRGQKSLTSAFYRLAARTGIGHRSWRDWWYGIAHQGVLRSTWETLLEAYEVALTSKLRELKAELEELRELRGGGYGCEGQAAN